MTSIDIAKIFLKDVHKESLHVSRIKESPWSRDLSESKLNPGFDEPVAILVTGPDENGCYEILYGKNHYESVIKEMPQYSENLLTCLVCPLMSNREKDILIDVVDFYGFIETPLHQCVAAQKFCRAIPLFHPEWDKSEIINALSVYLGKVSNDTAEMYYDCFNIDADYNIQSLVVGGDLSVQGGAKLNRIADPERRRQAISKVVFALLPNEEAEKYFADQNKSSVDQPAGEVHSLNTVKTKDRVRPSVNTGKNTSVKKTAAVITKDKPDPSKSEKNPSNPSTKTTKGKAQRGAKVITSHDRPGTSNAHPSNIEMVPVQSDGKMAIEKTDKQHKSTRVEMRKGNKTIPAKDVRARKAQIRSDLHSMKGAPKKKSNRSAAVIAKNHNHPTSVKRVHAASISNQTVKDDADSFADEIKKVGRILSALL